MLVGRDKFQGLLRFKRNVIDIQHFIGGIVQQKTILICSGALMRPDTIQFGYVWWPPGATDIQVKRSILADANGSPSRRANIIKL